jgi:hypothetical protein
VSVVSPKELLAIVCDHTKKTQYEMITSQKCLLKGHQKCLVVRVEVAMCKVASMFPIFPTHTSTVKE